MALPSLQLAHRRTALSSSIAYSIQTLRENPCGEIAGSLGDLGTLLPLMTAMAATGSINLNSTLIFSGLFNILSGLGFGIPIVVQPMKAIASIAISTEMPIQHTMGAGISVGAVIFLLSITGLLERAGRIIPIPIVKGIQVGAGLSLILNAGKQLKPLPWFAHSGLLDGLIWTILAMMLLFATSRNSRFPFALFTFGVGMVCAIIAFPVPPKIGVQIPQLDIPLPSDIKTGFFTAGIGQIPLTILNSIVGVHYLSKDLLPTRKAPSITALGLSVGLMNLTGCFFGSMPVCHGSGGLAAQYRFGARSGASVVLLGVLKLLLGLFVGTPLVQWLKAFPVAILGVLIFAAGIELVSVGRTLNTTAQDLHGSSVVDEATNLLPTTAVPISDRIASERWAMMTITAGALIAFRNDAVGFAAGCAFWGMLWVQERREMWRESLRD